MEALGATQKPLLHDVLPGWKDFVRRKLNLWDLLEFDAEEFKENACRHFGEESRETEQRDRPPICLWDALRWTWEDEEEPQRLKDKTVKIGVTEDNCRHFTQQSIELDWRLENLGELHECTEVGLLWAPMSRRCMKEVIRASDKLQQEAERLQLEIELGTVTASSTRIEQNKAAACRKKLEAGQKAKSNSEDSRQWMQQQREQVVKVHIYTDGSCVGGRDGEDEETTRQVRTPGQNGTLPDKKTSSAKMTSEEATDDKFAETPKEEDEQSKDSKKHEEEKNPDADRPTEKDTGAAKEKTKSGEDKHDAA